MPVVAHDVKSSGFTDTIFIYTNLHIHVNTNINIQTYKFDHWAFQCFSYKHRLIVA